VTNRDEKADMLDEFVIIKVWVNAWVARQINESFQSVMSCDLQFQ
jgi:hypothetical protein